MVQKIIPIVKEAEHTNPLDTICDLKWNYPIFNMERGEFRSCCRTPSNVISEEDLSTYGIDAFLNSPKMKESRLDLINGIRTSDCKTCWQIEDSGMTSPRHTGSQFWNHLRKRKQVADVEYTEDRLLSTLNNVKDMNDPILVSKYPYMLEISLGNTCDMKCMYCNHHYSTQWGAEEIKLGRITQEQYDKEFPKAPESFNEKFWEWFKEVGVKHSTRIGIIGGEPLIMPEFYKFVDRLIEAKKNSPVKQLTSLWIVTNLNTPKNYLEKFLQYLPKMSEIFNVEILVSMESVGVRAEYIRNGVDWNRFTANLDTLLSRKDVKFNFGFIPSLNVLSISSLKDFVMFTESLYKKHRRPVAIKHNIVQFPSHQSPFILTPEFATYVDECIAYMEPKTPYMPIVSDYYGRWDQFIEFLRPLSASLKDNTSDRDEQRRKFARWFDDFDNRRKLNLIETFPEYLDFYNMCKALK
jgi:sulfatase maturation enzyme AslB (radical SAM superfamily)